MIFRLHQPMNCGLSSAYTLRIILLLLAICKKIESISNGWVYGNGHLEGDTLSFRCRTDYLLEGEPGIRCTGNRRWNASTPSCRG